MGATMTEKIFARHTADGRARAGEIVELQPDVVLLNDVSGPVAAGPFAEMGATRVFDPDKVVLVADHFSPAKDVQSAELIRRLRSFGETYGIKSYYHTGNGGIEHAVLAETGRVYPGALVFGADSHTCTAGALNASGIGFGSTDLAAALALGSLWARVPDAIRVDLTGALPVYVSGKDVILEIIRRIGVDGALNAALEFGGPGLGALNVDERMAVANMAVEAGAETCVMEPDAAVEAYARAHGAHDFTATYPDAEAAYVAHIALDLSTLEPTIAAPPSPANGLPVSALLGTPVHQVYVGNCANGTLTDLRQVAAVLRGRQVAPNVRMFVVPATQAIYRDAMREGLLDVISQAGATISAPTCGACFGGHNGILAKGETAIATTNRNFRGRMGDPDSRVFLANAWVAAAAAVAGEIAHPGAFATPAQS
ncbi:3-isopropylmalate dehydratase large subunit [Xanthobacter tagetidis]|uniref:3-isopropylmalate dehydratase large subunit n=1 Tax=Xanthobacter tagetidis TaxID=60216 RepID=A0A3L7ABN7_9HYPH|nr:aconitase/3-isopropylmalate dehydratase large subunit family protein [Xanthobacter tagetidis]MBB6306077.1 3-isopropylmalate/(R)-2-methylmalate dehydratase large subunit [Xanthobacter tagetidis]RLP77637.1 homoaconitate hydratase family protein [Xanthobacter tagetidis]